MEDIENNQMTEQNIEDEVIVQITEDELCQEISENTNVPVDTVKTILASFIRHQLNTMKL